MKRAENVVNAKIQHIYFQDDALCFEFAKSKGRQEGEEAFGPWHIYANPLQPYVCPVLALSRYLLSFPEKINPTSPLLSGPEQYNRYAKILLDVVHELGDELKEMGISPSDIGTHSIRKGVATAVSAGCTVSPPLVSLCLRAGWVLGGVLMRYLKYEAAGDQYVGRCASGLDQLTSEFAISPPYFDYTDVSSRLLERVAMRERIFTWIKSRIPSGNVEGKTLDLVIMCFASICYHYSTLDRELHANSSFRHNIFFKDIPEEFKSLSKTALPWTKTAFTPKLTGVPPHVLLLAEMETLKVKFDSLRTQVSSDINAVLGNNGTLQAAQILRAVEESSRRIENLFVANQCSVGLNDGQHSNLNAVPLIIEDEEELDMLAPLPPNATGEIERELQHQRAEQVRAITRKRKLKVGVASFAGRMEDTVYDELGLVSESVHTQCQWKHSSFLLFGK